jgi:ATP synthase protein I
MSQSDDGSGRERGEISREDREALRKRAEAIGSRVEAARSQPGSGAGEQAGDAAARGSALGQAFKVAVELVAGVGVGGFIGWVLDKQLGTLPLFLAVFVMLGFAAGLLNTIRTARRLQAKAEPLQRSAPSIKDDDET